MYSEIIVLAHLYVQLTNNLHNQARDWRPSAANLLNNIFNKRERSERAEHRWLKLSWQSASKTHQAETGQQSAVC